MVYVSTINQVYIAISTSSEYNRKDCTVCIFQLNVRFLTLSENSVMMKYAILVLKGYSNQTDS